MERSLRASPEQFSAMIDYMERYGDMSRPQPGTQGRLRAESQWNKLTELLNSMGGGAVQKQSDKWKRVWSDWKTKTNKKAGILTRDTHGTGGGPSRARPLNPLEERVIRIMGLESITGQEEIPEAGLNVISEPIVRLPSPSQPARASSPPSEWLVQHSLPEIPSSLPVTEEFVEVESIPQATRRPSNTRTQNYATGSIRSPSVAPATSRRQRQRLPGLSSGQRRRRFQTPFEQVASEFLRNRLQLEERRIVLEHDREMERLRVESQRISMEESKNAIMQRIADIGNNLMLLLDRLLSERQ